MLLRAILSNNNKYGITGIKLTDDTLIRYWYSNSDLNIFKDVDLDDLNKDNCDYHYDVSYNGNNIKIEGNDCDGDDEYENNEIKEYDLSGVTLSPDLLNQAMGGDFDFGNTPDITFNSGKTYCTILWEHCWFDKDAMDQILSKLQ